MFGVLTIFAHDHHVDQKGSAAMLGVKVHLGIETQGTHHQKSKLVVA